MRSATSSAETGKTTRSRFWTEATPGTASASRSARSRCDARSMSPDRVTAPSRTGDVDVGGSHRRVRVERVEHRRLGIGVGAPGRVEEPETHAVRDALRAGHVTCRAHDLLALHDRADGPLEDHVAAEGLVGDLVRVDARIADQRLHDV